jgi:hypothetical protein
MPKTEDKFKTVTEPAWLTKPEEYPASATVVRKDSKWGKRFNQRQGEIVDYYKGKEEKNPDPYYKGRPAALNAVDRSASAKGAARAVGKDVATAAKMAKDERSKYAK